MYHFLMNGSPAKRPNFLPAFALLACAGVIVALTGLNPIEVYAAIIDGAVGSNRRLWVTLRDTLILLLVVVLLNIMFWLVEQLIQWDFEFLSVSYIISELLLLCLYSMLQDIEELQKQAAEQMQPAKEEEPEITEPEVQETPEQPAQEEQLTFSKEENLNRPPLSQDGILR